MQVQANLNPRSPISSTSPSHVITIEADNDPNHLETCKK